MEVTVAFSILVLAVLPILTLYSNTAQQTRQTGDYALAMMLEERVAEDMRIASWENPHAADDPAMAGDGTLLPVVDGKSPYFRGLEDTAAPYGQIDDDRDQVIDASMPALYRQLSTYQFGMRSGRRKLDTAGEVMDVSLAMQWRDARDVTRALELPTVLPILMPRVASPLVVRDRTVADKQIHDVLYWNRPAGETLDQAIAATGADAKTVRDLGDVLLIMAALAATRNDFDATKQQLTDAIARAAGGVDRFRAETELGRYLEARTAAYVQSVAYLGDKVSQLAAAGDSKLGTPPPDPAIYMDELVMAAWLPTRLAQAVTDSAIAYTTAYNDDAALDLPRVRARVFMKILELAKIQAVTAGLSDPNHIQDILASYNVAETGRNINFQKYGEAETQLCASLDSLKKAFSSPALITAYGAIAASGANAVQALLPPPPRGQRGGGGGGGFTTAAATGGNASSTTAGQQGAGGTAVGATSSGGSAVSAANGNPTVAAGGQGVSSGLATASGPGAAAPVASAPVGSAPVSSASGAGAAGATASGASASGAGAAGATASGASASGGSASGAGAAGATASGGSASGAGAAGATASGASASGGSASGAGVAGATASGASASGASASGAGVPVASAPVASVPPVNVPAVPPVPAVAVPPVPAVAVPPVPAVAVPPVPPVPAVPAVTVPPPATVLPAPVAAPAVPAPSLPGGTSAAAATSTF